MTGRDPEDLDGTPAEDPSEERETDGRDALTRLFAADGPADLDDDELFAGPLYWPGVTAADIAGRFAELRGWVDALFDRYEHVDHRVIPPCWWRHPGHIEALQALRDHERGTFAESSPAQAAASWQREFQFTEVRLREWTAYYGCDQSKHKTPSRRPRPVDGNEWSELIEREQLHRREREVAASQPSQAGEE